MTYRNRKLLDLAHTAPCFADFEHRCGGWEGCDPAHADSQMFGRGHGHKSHDCFFASMCHESHMMLETMDRDEGYYAWLRAYVATQVYLWTNGLVKVAK